LVLVGFDFVARTLMCVRFALVPKDRSKAGRTQTPDALQHAVKEFAGRLPLAVVG
jgi:hypothetical protein